MNVRGGCAGARFAACWGMRQQRLRLKESRSVGGLALGDHAQRVRLVGRQRIADGEVFLQFDVGSRIFGAHQVRRAFQNVKRVALGDRLEILDGVGGAQLERHRETSCDLHPVDIRFERHDEFGAIPFHGDRMLVLHLDALGAERRNRHDARRELLASARLIGVALSHLEQARIDGLRFRLLINLSGAAALQDHAGDPRDVVPHGEIGDGGLAGQRELIDALLHGVGVVAEDLPHTDPRDAVIDANLQRHFVEREHRGIGLLAVARNQHAGVRHRAGSADESEKR